MQNTSKPLVIVADDDPHSLDLAAFHLKRWGYRVACAPDRKHLLECLAAEIPALLLLDLQFGEHDGVEILESLLQQDRSLTVAMLTGHGSIATAVAAIKRGAYEYLTKPPDLDRLQVVVQHAVEKQKLTRKIQDLEKIVSDQSISRPIWGDSPEMRRMAEMIDTVAPTDATVLILGESGTGKELVARAIHQQSPRHSGPFVPVNMAAMPRELMESTLFGHERGAFTGADQVQRGCCEIADGGTLFLDEIGELDPDLQAKLLRFLQEKTVQRVGSAKIQNVDVRIVAATHRDPRELVKTGRLREDLYYRLNVIPIYVPPLRDRRADIPLLATLFLQRASVRNRKNVTGFADNVLQTLAAHDWPGNVRQLENLVERMVILSRNAEIGMDAIPPEIREAPLVGDLDDIRSAADSPATESSGELRAIDQIEKQAIINALVKSKGNVGDAARILGLGQATVYRKIKRYGIVPRELGI